MTPTTPGAPHVRNPPNHTTPFLVVMTSLNIETVLDAYIECALWSESIGEDFAADWARKTGEDEPASDVSLESFGFTADDLAPEALESMRADVADFLQGVDPSFLQFWMDELGEAQIGHDFWLTRNGHGAGFWDRFSAGIGERVGRHLTDAARPYGESYLYVGDDGKVYVS